MVVAVHAGFPEWDAVGSGAVIPCNSLVDVATELTTLRQPE